MKLYLSSYRIPTINTLIKMLPKPANECLVGVIKNAKDFREHSEIEQAKLNALAQDLFDIGFSEVLLIDLLSVDENFSFENFDVIYGAGGNTFALNYALHHTKEDKNLKKFIVNGGLYIGESAGAIIIGKSIKKFDSVDDEKRVPTVYGQGIGLLEKIVAPHADSPEYAKQVADTIHYYELLGEKVIVLNDNQAYVVDGNNEYIDTGEYFGDENRSRS